jgi:2-phospho-L-lactate guanylyltransferase
VKLGKTVAVLPVKSFGRAKSRTALEDGPRAALAEAMVADVLDALVAVPSLDGVLVVTREKLAAAAARAVGADVIEDPWEAGHSIAAAHGAAIAAAGGAERVLLVPGDCPGLDAAEVEALLAGTGGADAPGPAADAGRTAAPGLPGAEVVIVPDRHGSGTNALLLSPPDAIEPSFGPGSFARHAALARAAGARVRVANVPSLAFDIDTPEDLAALQIAGPRTRVLLRGTLAA